MENCSIDARHDVHILRYLNAWRRVVLARLHFSIIFQSLSNLLTGALMENSAIGLGRGRQVQTDREGSMDMDRETKRRGVVGMKGRGGGACEGRNK